jgi:hypothetical protein
MLKPECTPYVLSKVHKTKMLMGRTCALDAEFGGTGWRRETGKFESLEKHEGNLQNFI